MWVCIRKVFIINPLEIWLGVEPNLGKRPNFWKVFIINPLEQGR
jgi:hypothetical protein